MVRVEVAERASFAVLVHVVPGDHKDSEQTKHGQGGIVTGVVRGNGRVCDAKRVGEVATIDGTATTAVVMPQATVLDIEETHASCWIAMVEFGDLIRINEAYLHLCGMCEEPDAAGWQQRPRRLLGLVVVGVLGRNGPAKIAPAVGNFGLEAAGHVLEADNARRTKREGPRGAALVQLAQAGVLTRNGGNVRAEEVRANPMREFDPFVPVLTIETGGAGELVMVASL